MANPLVFTPTRINTTVRFKGGAFTTLDVRAIHPQTQTIKCKIEGTPAVVGDITLAKTLGSAWLTIPATAEDGVEFAAVIDVATLAPGKWPQGGNEVITANAAGYDEAQMYVKVLVQPSGGKPV